MVAGISRCMDNPEDVIKMITLRMLSSTQVSESDAIMIINLCPVKAIESFNDILRVITESSEMTGYLSIMNGLLVPRRRRRK